MSSTSESPTRQSEMPVGSVITIGHPHNERLAAKGRHGWRWLHSGELVDTEDFRGGWDIYPPATETDRPWHQRVFESVALMACCVAVAVAGLVAYCVDPGLSFVLPLLSVATLINVALWIKVGGLSHG